MQQTTGGSVTNYLWDEASTYGDVVLETDGSGAIQASYVVSQGEVLAQTRGGATSYSLLDGQGSVRALSNGSGGITDSYSYDAFGNPLTSSGSTTNPYRYTGQQLDSLTGLYDLRARSYDPTMGRFTSRDTASIDFSNPVELNRYSYAQDNPINLTDPSGHDPLDEDVEITSQVSLLGKVPGKVIAVVIAAVLIYVLTVLYTLTFLGQLFGPGTGVLPAPGTPPVGSPTPTPTPRPKEKYVADTGIFADANRLAPGERALLDLRYFDNPDVILYVPDAIYAEVSSTTSPTQLARLSGAPGGAQIVRVPDGSLAGIDVAALQSRNFGVNDMILVQTAKELNLPVLTVNKKLVNQIASNAARKAIWGSVPIIVA